MLGAALAIISAFSFSLNSVMSRRGLAVATASAGAFITVIMGVPLFLAAALATGQVFNAGDLSINGYIYLSAGGILHFGVGRYFNYRAAAAIGATRAQSVQALVVPYAILIAWLFLGESVTAITGLGISLILIGPTIMIQRGAKKAAAATVPASAATTSAQPAPAKPEFQLRQVEGYLSAIATIGAYGTSPILIRAGLRNTEDMAIYGGFVAYLAASVVLVLLTVIVPSRRGLLSSMNPATMRLFLSAGFFVFLAQMFRFMALAVADVAVVTPLMRTGAIFTLILSWLINKHLEVINLRVVAGLLLSAIGAGVIAINNT
jgi:drug/metabolite transporter (DMT)-like permease